MKRVSRIMVCFGLLLFLLGAEVNEGNALTWQWAFNSEVGTFITDGVEATPGWYSLADFSVTSSGLGATIGSWSGGQYAARGFWTLDPYEFLWDGASITRWDCEGLNTFDWVVFKDIVPNDFYLFGWQSSGINTVNQAAHYIYSNPDRERQPSYSLNVLPFDFIPMRIASSESNVSPVPEPATMILFGMGLIGLPFLKKRIRRG